jgi:fumarylacetoacetase
MRSLDPTHDAAARSWVASANAPGTDFPIQNLPFGVFRRRGGSEAFRGGVAIGDQVLDLGALAGTGCLEDQARMAAVACASPKLNDFLAMGPEAWHALRVGLFNLLHEDQPRRAPETSAVLRDCLAPLTAVEHDVPTRIGDYTDFYTSIHHARTISRLMPEALGKIPRNFQWVPTAYHGRVSSIGVSGQAIHRPRGQVLASGEDQPQYRPTERLDYELELAIYVGLGNALGHPIPMSQADDHIFGISLLNDWSARDIQAWEMVPLGPFHSKNFATTVSPWIVTLDALTPFRSPWKRPTEDPQPLAYLDSAEHRATGSLDINLEVLIETDKLRRRGLPPQRLSRTNFNTHYWSVAQMLVHHAAGGCNLQTGDVLGSGTISGPEPAEAGALIELALAGRQPVRLVTAEERSFLADGDAIVMHGWCERDGFARIGLGFARGEVLPSLPINQQETS